MMYPNPPPPPITPAERRKLTTLPPPAPPPLRPLPPDWAEGEPGEREWLWFVLLMIGVFLFFAIPAAYVLIVGRG